MAHRGSAKIGGIRDLSNGSFAGGIINPQSSNHQSAWERKTEWPGTRLFPGRSRASSFGMKGAVRGEIMNPLRLLAPCLFLLAGACTKEEAPVSEAASAPDPHADAIREFLKAPEQFQQVVATVRDEASFDRAAPELEKVVQKFRDAADSFKKLSPPDEANRPKYQQMIADGFRGAEPTGEDMISLVMLESREKEVTAWMESFKAAVGEAGAEAFRLYGKVDYIGAEEPLKIELGKPVIEGPPAEKPILIAPMEGGLGNPLLDHLREVPGDPLPDGDGR